MHPVLGQGLIIGGLGLGQFIFMVGEDEIGAAAVNVKGVAEIILTHGGTLDMPAGAPRPPGAVPGGFPGFAGLPKGKIKRIVFLQIDVDPGAGQHIVQAAPGELAVAGKFGHREIDVAFPGVGKTFGLEFGDEFDNIGNMFGGPGFDVGRGYSQCGHIPLEGGDIGFGDGFPGEYRPAGLAG